MKLCVRFCIFLSFSFEWLKGFCSSSSSQSVRVYAKWQRCLTHCSNCVCSKWHFAPHSKRTEQKKNDINVHRDNSSNASHSINVWPVYRRRRRQRWRRWCRNNYMHTRLMLLRAFPTPLPPFREMLSLQMLSMCCVCTWNRRCIFMRSGWFSRSKRNFPSEKSQVGCNWMDLIMKMNVLSF